MDLCAALKHENGFRLHNRDEPLNLCRIQPVQHASRIQHFLLRGNQRDLQTVQEGQHQRLMIPTSADRMSLVLFGFLVSARRAGHVNFCIDVRKMIKQYMYT